MNNGEISKLLQVLEESKNYVENGQEIPNEFCRILFPPEKREYELMYYGKESSESIISNTMPVPLQEDGIFPIGVKVKKDEWINKLISGQNLQVLKTLLKMKQEGRLKNADGTNGIRLIYIDPPFSTRKDFNAKGDEQKAYSDKLSGATFLEWLRKRLILLKELLSDDGTIYIHLDYRKCHYVKVLMDEIFGDTNMKNEIIWHYEKWTAPSGDSFQKNHDTIYMYSKRKNTFNTLKEVTDNLKNKYKNGYSIGGGYGSNGLIVYDKDSEKVKELISSGKYKVHYADMEGKPISDVWDIPFINPQAKERTGYPTQKPEALLERIIKASSNKGDIVLDCFAGSGTTPVVAEKLDRRWIAIDIGKLSIYTIQKRLLNLRDYKTKKKIKIKPFMKYSAGLYDADKLNDFDEENWKLFAMELWGCNPIEQTIKGFTFDGQKNNNLVKVYTPHELKRLKAKISIETIQSIDNAVNNSAGNEIFIIAPQGQFTFAEDDIEIKDRIYHILRIPYSMLAKFTEDFTIPLQPKDSSNVNEAIESEGFDFNQPPTVEYEIKDDELIIKKFESNSRIKGEEETELSMVLIDYEYKKDIFELDEVLYNKENFKNGKAKINTKKIKNKAMFIFIDSAGNEKKVVYNEQN